MHDFFYLKIVNYFYRVILVFVIPGTSCTDKLNQPCKTSLLLTLCRWHIPLIRWRPQPAGVGARPAVILQGKAGDKSASCLLHVKPRHTAAGWPMHDPECHSLLVLWNLHGDIQSDHNESRVLLEAMRMYKDIYLQHVVPSEPGAIIIVRDKTISMA